MTKAVSLFSVAAWVACASIQTSVLAAEEGDRQEPVRPIVAIEWIPLHSHSVVMKAFEESLAQTRITRVNVFGDEEELGETLSELAETPPKLILAFGDHVSQAVRERCPQVPLLALLVKLHGHQTAPASEKGSPAVYLRAEPDSELIWRLSRELVPGAKRVGIVYTENYQPNETLATRLERSAGPEGGQVVRATVPPGFCRSESDFSKAIRRMGKTEDLDVMYVPDDPNCSRFGARIYDFARELGIPAIGSEATLGKGCVAAVALDYEATGRLAASLCGDILMGGFKEATIVRAPYSIMIDREALAAYSLTVSPWLEENAVSWR